jgi:hypothetical protein
MKTALETVVWIAFFAGYGVVAAMVWVWLARRHVAFVKSQSSPSLRHDAPVFVLALATGSLPPVALILFAHWFNRPLSTWLVVAFCAVWVLVALPGIIRARRIMFAAGLNPDAA